MKNSTLTLMIILLAFFSTAKVNAQDVVDLTAIDNPDILGDTLPDLNSGTVVLLKPGMTYNAGGYAFTQSVTLQSSDPLNLNRPKIHCQANFNFGSGATVDSIIFRNIEFLGGYDDRYVINSNVTATIGKIMFDGCFIHDLRGIIRMKDAGPGTLDHYVINNSVVNRIRDYGIITVDRNDWICNHMTFTNSTFSKIRAPFITSKNNTETVTIEGCTLHEYTATGRRMFRWSEAGQDNVTGGITVRNTLWGTGWDELSTDSTLFDGFDGLGATTWTFENVYVTSDMGIAAEKDSITGFDNLYPGLCTDLWQNPAEGNFHYKDTAFTGIGNAGDQRWGIAYGDSGVVWNISEPAFNALGAIDTMRTVAGLTIFASSASPVVVDANEKELDTLTFSHRLKLGGGGAFDENGIPLRRVLTIDLMRSTKITVAAMSSSSGEDRLLNIAVGNKDTLLGEFPALGASLTSGHYSYYGGPAKLFLYSPGSGVNIYYIRTAEVPNIDAALSTLEVDDGTLVPAFDPAVLTYDLEVPYDTTTIMISATPTDPNATVTGTGEFVVPGTATVEVTAEDGVTKKPYTINVTVAAPSDDATLSALSVDVGTLTPATFDPAVLNYQLLVPAGTTSIVITATPNHPDATATGTGTFNLPGTAIIVVTAQDGTTKKEYRIVVAITGIDDIQKSVQKLYPNPVVDYLYVEQAKGSKLTILNTLGVAVMEVIPDSNIYQLNVTSLKPGNYFVTIMNKDGVVIRNMVKK